MKVIKVSPSTLLILVYGFFILIGSILLKLPWSVHTPIRWIDALFTSASAVTVTGLAVIDTGTVFTKFGQLVITMLIQVGGLGVMTFAILLYMILGKKIGLKERLIMQQALNQVNLGGLIRLVRQLFIFSISIEIVFMLVLSLQWVPDLGWKNGLFYSFFHSVSAFNNAGFSLWPDNLSRYVDSPVINIGITTLIILGGIGFTVIIEVWQKRKWSKLSLHSKMMLSATLCVNVISAFLVLMLEYHNNQTLGELPIVDKIWASYFQAVSTRTAGFNTIDMAGIDQSTAFLMIILMFIGAGSGSTGGGIKLTTFLILLLTVSAFIRGQQTIHIFKRSIPESNVWKVLAISMTSMFVISVGVLLLNITEKLPFLPLFFETVSAFGTVGLSMGITASFTIAGKLIIIFIMITGKVGPLSLVYILARKESCKYKYPSENIFTG